MATLTDYQRYATSLEHEPRTLLDRLLFRERLTPRAIAKLARRQRDDAYKAAARRISEPLRCSACGGGTVALRGVATGLASTGTRTQPSYRHADPRACAFVRYQRRPWGPAQLIARARRAIFR